MPKFARRWHHYRFIADAKPGTGLVHDLAQETEERRVDEILQKWRDRLYGETGAALAEGFQPCRRCMPEG